MATLEELVRHQIGESGPQLPSEEYEERIERELERMSTDELLRLISVVLEDQGILS